MFPKISPHIISLMLACALGPLAVTACGDSDTQPSAPAAGSGGEGGAGSGGSSGKGGSGNTSGKSGSGGSSVCTPGALNACPCAGGEDGVQTCQASGESFSPCDCSQSGGKGGTGGKAGSGGSGGAGAGGKAGSGGSGGSGGTGGSGGSGGSGQGGSGGSGASSCGTSSTGDPKCDACVTSEGGCCAQNKACADEPDCQALAGCLQGCQGGESPDICQKNCGNQHSVGAALRQAVTACIKDGACLKDCAGCTNIPPGGECGLFPDCGCDSNSKCVPVNAAGQTKCVPSGSKTAGDPCKDHGDCAPGLICNGLLDGQTHLCSALCDSSAFKCSCYLDVPVSASDLSPVSGVKACMQTCDQVNPTSFTSPKQGPVDHCQPGIGCGYLHTGQLQLSACMSPGGTIPVGSPCTPSPEPGPCVPGSECYDTGSGSPTCRRRCWEQQDCPAGTQCQGATQAFFGYCF